MSELTLDEATHRYALNGVHLPSVSRILDGVTDLSMIPKDVLEFKRTIGEALHLATKFYDEGALDEASVDDRVRPYLTAYIAFRKALPWTIAWMEQPLHHPVLKYAGTPDRVFRAAVTPVIVDLKTTTAIYPSVSLQLAGYAMLWAAKSPADPPAQRVSVQLLENGRFDLVTHSDADDFTTFMACLTRYRWLARHNLIKEKS